MFNEQDCGAWKVLIVAAMLTKATGFAVDVGQALTERVENVIKAVLAWIAQTAYLSGRIRAQ